MLAATAEAAPAVPAWRPTGTQHLGYAVGCAALGPGGAWLATSPSRSRDVLIYRRIEEGREAEGRAAAVDGASRPPSVRYELSAELRGAHDAPVSRLAFLPHGELVSVSHDRNASVWRAVGEERLATGWTAPGAGGVAAETRGAERSNPDRSGPGAKPATSSLGGSSWSRDLVLVNLPLALLDVAVEPAPARPGGAQRPARFAVSSSARRAAVLAWEPERRAWAPRTLRGAIAGAIMAAAWHPTLPVLALGGDDGSVVAVWVGVDGDEETAGSAGEAGGGSEGGPADEQGSQGSAATSAKRAADPGAPTPPSKRQCPLRRFGDVLWRTRAPRWVTRLRWSPDGRTLAVASGDASVALLEVGEGGDVARAGADAVGEAEAAEPSPTSTAVPLSLPARALEWLAPGRLLAAGFGTGLVELDLRTEGASAPPLGGDDEGARAPGRGAGSAGPAWTAPASAPPHVAPVSEILLADGGAAAEVLTVGLDGRLVTWR